jgi:predicted transcriptional regulator of viral defense system
MLEALVKALGKTRQGKSLEQLQGRLGWTKIQLRNAISRAGAKGFVELVTPGVYRQKV